MNSDGIYGRFGLSGNPFRELTSESLESVGLLHVPQAIDSSLYSIRDEIEAVSYTHLRAHET